MICFFDGSPLDDCIFPIVTGKLYERIVTNILKEVVNYHILLQFNLLRDIPPCDDTKTRREIVLLACDRFT